MKTKNENSSENHGPEIEKFTKRDVQVACACHVNDRKYDEGGEEEVADHNRQNCLIHTGYRPSQLKEVATLFGVPAKNRTSGREVIRRSQRRWPWPTAWSPRVTGSKTSRA